jgi:hypothetical protein
MQKKRKSYKKISTLIRDFWLTRGRKKRGEERERERERGRNKKEPKAFLTNCFVCTVVQRPEWLKRKISSF